MWAPPRRVFLVRSPDGREICWPGPRTRQSAMVFLSERRNIRGRTGSGRTSFDNGAFAPDGGWPVPSEHTRWRCRAVTQLGDTRSLDRRPRWIRRLFLFPSRVLDVSAPAAFTQSVSKPNRWRRLYTRSVYKNSDFTLRAIIAEHREEFRATVTLFVTFDRSRRFENGRLSVLGRGWEGFTTFGVANERSCSKTLYTKRSIVRELVVAVGRW